MNEELINYLISYCREWMLPEEKRALIRVGMTKHGEAHSRQNALAEKKIELIYGYTDEKTNTLVALGPEKLRLTIAERLYRQHYKKVINCCPNCSKLCRTPYAKQCRYCGEDWH